jgi:hypothetical protein
MSDDIPTEGYQCSEKEKGNEMEKSDDRGDRA